MSWRPKFLSVSLYDEPFSSYGKVHWMTSKWTWPKHPCAFIVCPGGPNVNPFHSMTSHFWVTPQFWEMCTERHQNDLDIFKDKSTHIHTCTSYDPEAHIIFICFALSWAIFELWSNSEKRAPNDPKMALTVQGQSTPYAFHIHPEAQFFFVSLYNEQSRI